MTPKSMTPEQKKEAIAKEKKKIVRELAEKIFCANMAAADLDPVAKTEGEVSAIQMELKRKLDAMAHTSISAAVIFYRTWKSRKEAINTETL